MGYLNLEKNNLWAEFCTSKQRYRIKKPQSMQKVLKNLKNAMSPALFSHSNFSSDFIQYFCQWISPVLFCTWKEEGNAATLDRAAQFTGFLQEAVPWLWAELADSEPVWQSLTAPPEVLVTSTAPMTGGQRQYNLNHQGNDDEWSCQI